LRRPSWVVPRIGTREPAIGRAYAAYDGVYVATAIVWGWLVAGQRPDRWDLPGEAVTLVGMAIIAFGPLD